MQVGDKYWIQKSKTVEILNTNNHWNKILNSRAVRAAFSVLLNLAAATGLVLNIDSVKTLAGEIQARPNTTSVSQIPMDNIDYDNTNVTGPQRIEKNPQDLNGSAESPKPVDQTVDDLQYKIDSTSSGDLQSDPNYKIQNQNLRAQKLQNLKNIFHRNAQTANTARLNNLRSGVKPPASGINIDPGISRDGLENFTFSAFKTESTSRLIPVLKPGQNTNFADGLSHLYTESSTAAVIRRTGERTVEYQKIQPTQDSYVFIGAQVYGDQIPPPSTEDNPSPLSDGKPRTLLPGTESPVVINPKDGNFYLNPQSAIYRGQPPEVDFENFIPSGSLTIDQTLENTASNDQTTRQAELFGTLNPDGTVTRGSGFVLGNKLSDTPSGNSEFSKKVTTETVYEISNSNTRDLRGLNPQTGAFEITTDTRGLRLNNKYSGLANLAALIPWIVQKPGGDPVAIVPEPYRGSLSGAGFTDQQLKTRAYVAANAAGIFAPEFVNRSLQYTQANKNGNVFSILAGVGTQTRTDLTIKTSEDYKPFSQNPLSPTVNVNQPFDSSGGEAQVESNGGNLGGSFSGQVGVNLLDGNGLRTYGKTETYKITTRPQFFAAGLYSVSRNSRPEITSNGVDPVADIGAKIALVQNQRGDWVPAAQASVTIYPTKNIQIGGNIRYSGAPDIYTPNLYTLGVQAKLSANVAASVNMVNYFANESLYSLRFDNALNLGLDVRLNKHLVLSSVYDLNNQNASLSTIYTGTDSIYRVGASYSNSRDNGSLLNLNWGWNLSTGSSIGLDLNYSWDNKLNIFLPETGYSAVLRYNSNF